ncbi:MAG: hypothetical protein Q7S16_02390 [bacterium]|nr:hypothetical protein [bacterium]
MLDQNDLKQIGTVIKENNKELTKDITKDIMGQVGILIAENNKELTKEIVGQVRVELGEFITDNVLTAIDDAEERLSEKINTLPTKDDLVRVVASAQGEVVAQLRREDEKVNLQTRFLKEANVLTDEHCKALRALQVFPSIEI